MVDMSRHGDGQPDASAATWLAAALRDEGERHEPDRARISAAIAAGMHGRAAVDPVDAEVTHLTPPAEAGATHQVAPAGRARARATSRAPLGRAGRPLLAAAAAALLVAGVAGARLAGGHGELAGTVTPAGASGVQAAPTPSRATPTGTSATPAARPTASDPTTQAGSRTAPKGTSTPRVVPPVPTATLAEAVTIDVRAAAPGTSLHLPRPGDRDWIVVGGRNDGVTVRAKRPARRLGSVEVRGGGAVVDGPYRLGWQDGSPEQERDGAGTWLQAASGGLIRTGVPLEGDSFTVELYLGTVRAAGTVTVGVPAVPGAGRIVATLPGCSADVCPDVVTVTVDGARLPAGATTGELLIEVAAGRPGAGSLSGPGLAAVVLR